MNYSVGTTLVEIECNHNDKVTTDHVLRGDIKAINVNCDVRLIASSYSTRPFMIGAPTYVIT